jgi:molecular chaperone HscB
MPADFLMQQMEWREALDEASSEADLDVINARVMKTRREALQDCEQLLDVAHDYPGAVARVRTLMFIERFIRDIEARFDRMDTGNRGQ